jgi:hypothetical protein
VYHSEGSYPPGPGQNSLLIPIGVALAATSALATLPAVVVLLTFLLWLGRGSVGGRGSVNGEALRCGGRRRAKIASRVCHNAGRL